MCDFEEGAIHKSTTIKFFKRLNEGDCSLLDQLDSRRQREVADGVLVEMLKDANHASTRELSAALGSSH